MESKPQIHTMTTHNNIVKSETVKPHKFEPFPDGNCKICSYSKMDEIHGLTGRFRVSFPFIDDMGTISPMIVESSYMETAQQNALWHLNSMRDHDGQEHLTELPDGTVFEPIR